MNSQHLVLIHNMSDEIDSLHRSYLHTEECLKKIGEQTKLEDVIRQYLSLVPHIKKFFFPKISYVLHKSIRDKKDFSPFMAISAWSALAKYAHNILSQPWRKEFYTIQKYGGYFSHVIKEVLVDWETVFELMGYNTYRDIMVLKEPIDPDKIMFVARDCFIAQVECQIMMKIYASVLKIHNDCTWQDILDFRENYTCSTEQAIRGLCDLFLQRQQDEYRVGEGCMASPYTYPTLPPFHTAPCMRYNDFKQVAPYGNGINMAPHIKAVQNYSYPNCAKHMIPNPMQISDTSYMQPYQGNGYGVPFADKPVCPQYIYPSPSPYSCMDMDDRDRCSNCHHDYNYSPSYPYSYSNNKYIDRSYDYHKQRNKHSVKSDNFVRTDTTDNTPRQSKDYHLSNVKCNLVPMTELENAMKAFDFDKNTLPDSDQSDKAYLSDPVSENIPIPTKNNDRFEKHESSSLDIWECEKCTYHNSIKQSICDMCGKSRRSGNEKIPLVSGGRHCCNCTLVNERDAKTCEACNSNLKDSPTYI